MKVIHITSKILLLAVEIAVIALILVSVIPMVAGGLAIDVEKDPEAVLDGENVKIDGEIAVTSSLIWDITDFTYYVSVGNDDMTVAQSAPVMMNIPKGETSYISFLIEVPVTSLALLMVDTGLDENGNLGNMNIPLQFGISGAYIQSLVKFDFNVDMTVEMTGTAGSVTYDDVNNRLDISITYKPATDLGIPEVSGTIDVGSGDATGTFAITKDVNGEYTFEFSLGTDTATELLDALEGNDVTIRIGGQDYTFSSEDVDAMTSLIKDLLEKLGVTL